MSNKYLKHAGWGVVLAAVSGIAFAQSTTTCEERFQWAETGFNGYTLERIAQNHPECLGGSGTTSTVVIGATAFSQATAISNALAARPGKTGKGGPLASVDGISGLAAGGQAQSWNGWISYSDSDSSVIVNNGAGRTDNGTNAIVFGGDMALSAAMTVGLSASFDRTGGNTLAGIKSASDGFMIAPYLGYQLNKDIALDVSLGIGQSEFSTGAIRADANRWFAAGNLTHTQWLGKVQLNSKLSLMHGVERYKDSRNNGTGIAGSASTNTVDQLRGGVRAGYWMDGVMPYAGLIYAADIRRASTLGGVDPLGRGAFVLSVGVDFFSLSSKVTGGVAYEQESGRTNSKNETLMANVNFRF